MKRRYEKGARAESEARNRQAIIDAAVACFSENPFDRVTVSDVAGRAGLSAQTLLRVYGSKEELFLAAVRSVSSSVIGRRDRVDSGDVEAAVAVLVDDYERWGGTHERLFVRARTLPELAALFEEWRLLHRQWVRRVFADELELRSAVERARLLALLVVALDIDTYRRLRSEGLSRTAATQALRHAVIALLAIDGDRDEGRAHAPAREARGHRGRARRE